MPREVALNWMRNNEPLIAQVANDIWQFAELAMSEFKSSNLIANTLTQAGLEVRMGVAGMTTAFTARYGSGKPVIGVVGEYDALPGLSQKAQSTKEPNVSGGAGHGCGHNVLGAASMGATIAIKEAIEKRNLKGSVKFFGCPAEETLTGKVLMVRDGLFNDVDAALCWHPSVTNTVELSSALAMNSVKFSFHGTPAHAAGSPEQGRSALDAVELMNIGVNYLREHVIEKARIHYVVTDGGRVPNVVPAEAQVWYFIRAPKRVEVESIFTRVRNIASGACMMTGTGMDIEFLAGCHETRPNKTLSHMMLHNMKEAGAPQWTDQETEFAEKLSGSISQDQKRAVMESMNVPCTRDKLRKVLDDRVDDPEDEGRIVSGSTDLGDVSYVTPTGQALTAGAILGASYHSWQMTATSGMSIGHKGGILAAKVIALTALDLLTRPENLKRVRDEFETSMKGIAYKSPLS